MKTLIGWSLVALAIVYGLSGCVSLHSKDIRVLTSRDNIKQQHFIVDNGSTLICDPKGCREAD